MKKTRNKPVTIDQLAIMIQRGFEETASKSDLKNAEANLGNKIDKLDNRMANLEYKVSHHLDLSLERYLELKHQNKLMVKWIQVIANKTGVSIDFGETGK